MIPYCPQDSPEPRGKNIVYAYMECMARLRDDDWAVLIDHDVVFLTPHWYPMIERAIAQKPDAGGFFCWQHNGILPQANPGSPPVEAHLKEHTVFAERVAAAAKDTLTDITEDSGSGLIGFFQVISKKTWDACGLNDPAVWATRPDPRVVGMRPGHRALAYNDLFMTKRILASGRRLYRLDGLYVYHWSFHPTYEPQFGPGIFIARYEKDYAAELA